MKTIDMLCMQFNGALRINLQQAATVTGFSASTLRNRIQARRWPIPFQREGDSPRGRIYFDIRDVAAYLDDRAAGAVRRRGRPTKAETASRMTEKGV